MTVLCQYKHETYSRLYLVKPQCPQAKRSPWSAMKNPGPHRSQYGRSRVNPVSPILYRVYAPFSFFLTFGFFFPLGLAAGLSSSGFSAGASAGGAAAGFSVTLGAALGAAFSGGAVSFFPFGFSAICFILLSLLVSLPFLLAEVEFQVFLRLLSFLWVGFFRLCVLLQCAELARLSRRRWLLL
jgi:hypothetical protein